MSCWERLLNPQPFENRWPIEDSWRSRTFVLVAPSARIGHILHMGRVVVKIKLTNHGDLVAVHRKLTKAKPRTAEAEALVDTGATRLYLQSSLIKALGLHKESEVEPKTSNGVRRRAVFEPVRLELMGRN